MGGIERNISKKHFCNVMLFCSLSNWMGTLFCLFDCPYFISGTYFKFIGWRPGQNLCYLPYHAVDCPPCLNQYIDFVLCTNKNEKEDQTQALPYISAFPTNSLPTKSVGKGIKKTKKIRLSCTDDRLFPSRKKEDVTPI